MFVRQLPVRYHGALCVNPTTTATRDEYLRDTNACFHAHWMLTSNFSLGGAFICFESSISDLGDDTYAVTSTSGMCG